MRTAAVDRECSLQQEKVEPLAVSVHLQNADHMRCVAGLAAGLCRRSAGHMCRYGMRKPPAWHRRWEFVVYGRATLDMDST